MSDTPTFMELALRGQVLPDEIDDFVDVWHESDSDRELHDFLGMSFQEYSLWVAQPDFVEIIIAARHAEKPITDAVNDNLSHQERLAARADEAGKIAFLRRWIAAQPDR